MKIEFGLIIMIKIATVQEESFVMTYQETQVVKDSSNCVTNIFLNSLIS